MARRLCVDLSTVCVIFWTAKAITDGLTVSTVDGVLVCGLVWSSPLLGRQHRASGTQSGMAWR